MLSQKFLPAVLIPSLLVAPAMAEVPQVMTDMPVTQSFVAQVMGDLGTPEVLLDKGADPHNFQLRPSQAAGLQEADLVIWVGPKMTPWLDRALAGIAAGTPQITLTTVPGTYLREFSEPLIAHGHDHDDHSHDLEHVHDGLDPHAWLDPDNALFWLGVIADRLAEADPVNAAAYHANAETAQDAVRALEAELIADLAPVKDRAFITAHDAYGYFAGHFQLAAAGSVALGDAAAPGAAHLSELHEALAEKQVICAFPEVQHDPKPMQVVLEGTDVKLGAALDPEGVLMERGAGLYPALMRNLADALRDCLAP